MHVFNTIAPTRVQITAWRRQQLTVAFVPTMGNLHQGHLSLVTAAKKRADRVAVSIFVNPLQFDNEHDLLAYPRTADADIQQLLSAECDLVFTPDDKLMYPQGVMACTRISVPGMNDKLCGRARPGHFDGVATVVAKLFNIVCPDIAVFGEKDYQQLLLIKRMVNDLNLTIDIVGVPTLREKNGLAMSSRNQHLTPSQYKKAAGLYQTLLAVQQQLTRQRDFMLVQKKALFELTKSGFAPEYVDICCEDNLAQAMPGEKSLRILAAARLGKVRLIDNIACYLD